MALWFHDAIFDVKASDNEARSAAWARQALHDAGAPADCVERVYALVMATRHDIMPSDSDQQLLVDIDLSILGSSPARFAQYEKQVRAEYSFVPDDAFPTGRRAILQSFLVRTHIYLDQARRSAGRIMGCSMQGSTGHRVWFDLC